MTSTSTSRDSIGNTRKTASGNYCETWSAIQRLDQNLWAFSAFIPAWRDMTLSSTSRDSIGTTRKTASGNYCQTVSAIQQSDQKLWPFQLLFRSGATWHPLQRVGIPYVIQGKQPPETVVKLGARSNGRIKSYGSFQLLFRSGATWQHLQRVGIP